MSGASDVTPENDIDGVFQLVQQQLAANPDLAQMLYLCDWHAWLLRQLHPVRVFEERYVNGELVSRRDVTPDDPEPQPPVKSNDGMTPTFMSQPSA